MTDNTLTLSVFDDIFAICRFSPHEPIPEWAAVGPFCSMTRTVDELSIVCLEKHVPEGVDCERRLARAEVRRLLQIFTCRDVSLDRRSVDRSRRPCLHHPK